MEFYLGTHMAGWLAKDLGFPLFVSRRRLFERKTLPVAAQRWALDSGGFTELSLYDGWVTPLDEYVSDVRRFVAHIGSLDWVAPQDWMCEPWILQKTGLTVEEHQRRTTDNFLRLRQELGALVIPVLQGWELNDYLRHVEAYLTAGVNLELEPVVGVGSVCRRQATPEAREIVEALSFLPLHYFGAKMTGLAAFHQLLRSADSMAWSYDGRRLKTPCPRGKVSCNNCLHHAITWRDRLMSRITEEAA